MQHPDPTSVTFNVVYTPGTVRYLKVALFSLMDRSDFRFRLVGNGITAAEAAELRALARGSDRLEVTFFPSPRMLPHGLVLSLLFHRFPDGPYFAFCDPDIFAIGPFQHRVLSRIAQYDVFSSCYHIGLRGEVVAGGFHGRCLYGPGGMPLATTFFAVYRRAAVEQVRLKWGIAFERYLLAEHVPPAVAAVLRRRGIFLPPFDTAKLLNALMNLEGMTLCYEDMEELCHIGGIARALAPSRDWRVHLRVEPLRLLSRRAVITERRLRRLQRLYMQAPGGGRADTGRNEQSARLLALRTCIAEYFAAYLKHLVDGGPPPTLRLHDAALRRRLHQMCQVIRGAFMRFGPEPTQALEYELVRAA